MRASLLSMSSNCSSETSRSSALDWHRYWGYVEQLPMQEHCKRWTRPRQRLFTSRAPYPHARPNVTRRLYQSSFRFFTLRLSSDSIDWYERLVSRLQYCHGTVNLVSKTQGKDDEGHAGEQNWKTRRFIQVHTTPINTKPRFGLVKEKKIHLRQ